MAKFKYRMQNILNIKQKLEDQAKMQYAAMRAKLTEEEQQLALLMSKKTAYFLEGKRIRENILNVRELKDNRNAIEKMNESIEQQQLQIRVAEKNLEIARVELQEVMTERKTHEKLRERAFDQFIQDINSQESKEIDQLTSYQYGKKLIEDNLRYKEA